MGSYEVQLTESQVDIECEAIKLSIETPAINFEVQWYVLQFTIPPLLADLASQLSGFRYQIGCLRSQGKKDMRPAFLTARKRAGMWAVLLSVSEGKFRVVKSRAT